MYGAALAQTHYICCASSTYICIYHIYTIVDPLGFCWDVVSCFLVATHLVRLSLNTIWVKFFPWSLVRRVCSYSLSWEGGSDTMCFSSTQLGHTFFGVWNIYALYGSSLAESVRMCCVCVRCREGFVEFASGPAVFKCF